jgi:AraC family transcriptional regulator of adaptative response/methylated-DNA-[protein]-cysteine methyltransferase
MYEALLRRDSSYEGVFFVAVKTTGIFCRPTCSARKPNRDNVQFFGQARDALASGYRPCRRCHPLDAPEEMPQWCRRVIEEVERHPDRRWRDADLREMGVAPEKIRRWFQTHHNMTFQAYVRARRMTQAMGQIQSGDSVTMAAAQSGYESLSGFRDAFRKWSGASPSSTPGGCSPLFANRILTELGPMFCVVGDDGLHLLEFADRRMLETQIKRLVRRSKRPLSTGDHPCMARVREQIEGYFAGNLQTFDLPLVMHGTDFQKRVWSELLKIPYGQTRSYESIARHIGQPGGSRAVGRANGDNAIAIVVPCHRVVRADGTLCGYGGGLWRKARLLELESAGRGSRLF